VKILELLADTPEMTIPQLAKAFGISTRAIEKQIAKLQKSNQ
jgi:DeoR/GlpR family transcriptional regulator of sugar metabolism